MSKKDKGTKAKTSAETQGDETLAQKQKRLKAEKKAIADEQKAIKEKLDAGKAERKEARGKVAKHRKAAKANAATVRKLVASIGSTFKSKEVADIKKLADELTENCTALATEVRSFGEALDETVEL